MKIKLIVLFSSIIFAVIFLEVFYRYKSSEEIDLSWRSMGAHQLDSELIYVNHPNFEFTTENSDFSETVKINSDGFRDHKIKEKVVSVKRIVLVGDSFVFGYGISENKKTISEIMENQLKNADVINTGVRGYSPDQEYKFIITRILKLKPDLVVWELNPHDIENMKYFPSLYDLDNNRNLKPTDAKQTWIYWQGKIINKWPFLYHKSFLLKNILNNFSRTPYLNRALLIPENKRHAWILSKLTKEIIEASKYLDNKGIKLLVAFFPVKYSYTSDTYNANYSEAFDIFKILKLNLNKNSIQYIDIGELIWNINTRDFDSLADIHFQILGLETIDPLSLFFQKDYHFNDIGAEISAKILAENLKHVLGKEN